MRGVYGGSMNYYDNKLYVFGGYSPLYFYSNIMTVYSFNDNIFKEIKSSNQPPTPRSYHRTCIYKHYIVLFGGGSQSNKLHNKYYNELYLYDIINNKWTLYPVNNKPQTRYNG